MLEVRSRQSWICVAFCIFMFTAQWSEVISSSIPTTTTDFDSQEEEYDNNNQHFINNENLSLFEYSDDLDADIRLQVQREMQDTDWDVLIFTQQWPVTTCYHWREEDKSRSCQLPHKKEFWTIHGIWPTKLGHIGPSFCNKSAEFDLNQLQVILERLEQYWPEIDADAKVDYLWKHEWLKHGTCAARLEDFDNELKYFKQGLVWRDKYLISALLGSSGIHPDSNNTVIALQAALVRALGKNPSIHCLYDNKNDVSYLSEIRICFNKQLELIDCDGVKVGDVVSIDYPGGTVITNCHISKPVHYPSIVPPVLRENGEKWKFPVVNTYKLLQFIMWFTL